MIGLIDEGRAMDIVYLVFSKAFNTVSYKMLREELVKYGLNKQTVRCTENLLNDQVQRVVVNSKKSSCSPFASNIRGDSTWSSPVQFLCSGLDDRAERTVSKSTNDTKLSRVVGTPECSAAERY